MTHILSEFKLVFMHWLWISGCQISLSRRWKLAYAHQTSQLFIFRPVYDDERRRLSEYYKFCAKYFAN